ncbi:cytochrome c3 family protein [Calditrichota bacterium GD2]
MHKYILVAMILFLLLAQGRAQEEDCTSAGCHQGLINKPVIHPAIEDDCLSCHESNDKQHPDSSGNEFSLISEVPELCYNCHDQKDNLTVVHEPVEAGGCLDCHSPHSSEKSGLLLGEEDESICASCHEIETDKTIHPPYEEQDCIACHDPHHSLRASLLKTERPELCFECHDDKRELLSSDYVHEPFEEECESCHTPHVSKYKNLLIQKSPDLCFNCHDTEDAEVESKHIVHGPLKETSPCLKCHTPHATNNEFILKAETPELCLNCHNSSDPSIFDMEKRLKQAHVIHAPIEDEGCLICHNVHKEEFPFLLTGKFPATSYTESDPENFALCFNCHDSEILNPQNLDTGFIDGKTNLHALHISGEKGRSCTLCHDVHGAQSVHLIPKTVRFGKWDMPMNFKYDEKGGSCAPGCHAPKSYRR